MISEQEDADIFMAHVEQLVHCHPALTHLQAGVLVAARQGIAHDSRSFSRLLGVAHAIVLREVNALEQMGDYLRITDRNNRTLRSHYELTADGLRLTAMLDPAKNDSV